MASRRMLRAGLVYAERFGFAVFPCRPRAKVPLTEHGCKDATRDPERIGEWWKRWPDANLGIATGTVSEIVVLDIDPPHGGAEALTALQEKHTKLPETPMVLTGGGGIHLYFRHPGVIVPNSASKVGRGMDVRGEGGGYVVAPRSNHESGNSYLWESSARIDALPLAKLPIWLLELMTMANQMCGDKTPLNRTLNAATYLERLVAGVPEGDRDNQLFRLACYLRRRGYNRAQAEPLLRDAAVRCRPPFPVVEALRKWRWP